MGKNQNNYKQLLAERKAAGLCRCGNHPIPERKLCSKCAASGRATQAKRRKKHKDNKTCITCGNPNLVTKTACQICIDRATKSILKKYEQNKTNKVCAFCGNKLDGSSKFRCDSCHKYHLINNKTSWHKKRNSILSSINKS